jgi:hypothetical protein
MKTIEVTVGGEKKTLLEIGTLTPGSLRPTRKSSPLDKMFVRLTSLLEKQGVRDVPKSGLTISEIYTTEATEKLVLKECRRWLRKNHPTATKRYLDKQTAWAVLDMPANLRSKREEKRAGMKDGKVYVVQSELSKALKK